MMRAAVLRLPLQRCIATPPVMIPSSTCCRQPSKLHGSRFLCAATSHVAAAPQEVSSSSSSSTSTAIDRIRQRAGSELTAWAEQGPYHLEAMLLRSAQEVVLQMQPTSSAGTEDEARKKGEEPTTAAEASTLLSPPELVTRASQEAITLARDIEEGRRERTRLRADRADILAVGFQTTGAENQEFASLVVCATAGVFAVSIHWGFFSIFAVAYALYRRSTRAIQKQRAAVDSLQDIVDRLKELDRVEAEKQAALQGLAAAWLEGRSE